LSSVRLTKGLVEISWSVVLKLNWVGPYFKLEEIKKTVLGGKKFLWKKFKNNSTQQSF
jgi:hypothetical protein